MDAQKNARMRYDDVVCRHRHMRGDDAAIAATVLSATFNRPTPIFTNTNPPRPHAAFRQSLFIFYLPHRASVACWCAFRMLQQRERCRWGHTCCAAEPPATCAFLGLPHMIQVIFDVFIGVSKRRIFFFSLYRYCC